MAPLPPCAQIQMRRRSVRTHVEKHDAPWPAPHRFRQKTAVVVAHIPRRRSDQARDAVLLEVLRHVQPHHLLLVVEQLLGQRLGQFSLAHAGRTHEQEAANGALPRREAGACTEHRVRHCQHCVRLADDAPPQPLSQPQHARRLVAREARDGDAGPAAHDACGGERR
eukprot:COSAG01_NODE_1064_length_11885_cov_7.744358_9_plen_167_part_00